MKAKRNLTFNGKEDFKNSLKTKQYGFVKSNKYDISCFSFFDNYTPPDTCLKPKVDYFLTLNTQFIIVEIKVF
jgi:hypothetical protein